MDPVTLTTLASLAVSTLSPLLEKGADEIAKSAFKDVYASAKGRLLKKPEGKEAVEKFEQDPTAGSAVFQAELVKVLAEQATLARSLAEALEKSDPSLCGTLVGNIKAEKVVVANKIGKVEM